MTKTIERIMMKLNNFLLIISFFVLIFNQPVSYGKMRLYTFYTPSHKILLENYFLPSIKDNYEVIVAKIEDQVCPSARFYSKNWSLAVANKADLIIKAIEENWGNYFIYSDVDIQFFKPTEEYILSHIKDLDLLAQAATHLVSEKRVCTGFMVIKANNKSLEIWRDIKNSLTKTNKYGDQHYFNQFLKKYKINYELLPIEFYLPANIWKVGDYLKIPSNIILHHANWTVGIDNKIKQLDYVQSLVEKLKSKE